MITWDPQTLEHLSKINAAIDEMEAQVQTSGTTMIQIVDMNAGATIQSINEHYSSVVAPQLKSTLESFREFVKGVAARYQAAFDQDSQNAMH